MKHKDFRIGSHFFMDSRKYLCTDIGTRTICAVRADFADIATSHNGKRTTENRKLTKKDIGGPPYWLLESVIDENDIEVCFKTRPAAESAHGPLGGKMKIAAKSPLSVKGRKPFISTKELVQIIREQK